MLVICAIPPVEVVPWLLAPPLVTPAAPSGVVVQMRSTWIPLVGQGSTTTAPAVPLPTAVLAPLFAVPVPVESTVMLWSV
jgi:hypothetical protein